MKNFTIENETNNITVHGSAKEAEAVPNSERFGTEAGPGETQVKKFKDRATAVNRIRKAIQRLGETAPAAEQTAPVSETAPAPEKAGDTAQPEPGIPESQEPAPPTTVAPQSPGPKEGARRRANERSWRPSRG
jgi:hypothetical protein